MVVLLLLELLLLLVAFLVPLLKMRILISKSLLRLRKIRRLENITLIWLRCKISGILISGIARMRIIRPRHKCSALRMPVLTLICFIRMVSVV